MSLCRSLPSLAVERMAMARLSIELFGPFQVTLDGEPVIGLRTDKVRALLAYLAVEAQSPQRREKLAGLLWQEWTESSARANLRQALANLRRAIGDHEAMPPFLHITRKTIQFYRASDAWADVTTFTDLREAAGTPQQMIRQMEDMVELYQGDLMEGFTIGDSPAFEEWALLKREMLRRLVIEVLRRLSRHYQERGEYECALQYAWRQVDLDPWREKAHQQVMRLLAQNGQRGAALAQFAACQRLLGDKLGVEPAAVTVQLYGQIRDGAILVAESPPVRPPEFVALQTPPPFGQGSAERLDVPVVVGREPEIERMSLALERARAGEGRVLFVTGDAGRGKTALLGELARRGMDAHEDLIVATGSCNAHSGVGDPYLPFRDIMAMLTGDIEGRWAAGLLGLEHARRLWEVLPVAAQMLVNRGPQLIDIFLPGKELVARATAAASGKADWLEQLKGLIAQKRKGAGGLEQSLIFEQYANVLRGLAAQRPLLIVVDDLQWADAASTSLLFHLGRRIEGHPILLVGAYRPDEVALGRDGERHPLETILTEFKRQYGDICIDLDETGQERAREFIDLFLDTEPNRLGPEFRQMLFRRTGGHPLFTVELLRALQERESLKLDDRGRWTAGPGLDWETLPARVEGVLEERIARIRTELHEILEVASVEGGRFTAQVVARVMQVPERQILRELTQELQRRHRLVYERDELQAGCKHVTRYEFAHVPLQRYLYHGLGVGERRLLHREIALALEELYEGRTEEIAGQLARHYEGDADQERHYAQLAGERAAAQYANADALRYLTRALELTPDSEPTTRYSLLLVRERVLNLQGERTKQVKDLAELQQLTSSMDDDGAQVASRQSEVALREASYADAISDYPAAILAAQDAIRLAEVGQDAGREAAGYLRWGRVLCSQADYPDARSRLERALSLARAAQVRQVEGDSLRNLGLVSWLQGEHDEAEVCFVQALGIYRELGDRRFEGGTLNNLGLVCSERGSHSEAVAFYEQALSIFCQVGDRRGESIVLGNLAGTALALGDIARANAIYEQTLSLCREIDDRTGECRILANLILQYHHQGEDGKALDFGQQALLFAQELGNRRWQAYALTNLGHSQVALGLLEEGRESYQQALSIRREMGEDHMVIESLAGLARACLAQGDLAAARDSIEEILGYLEDHTVEGTDEPLRIYLTIYLVQQATQDSRAVETLETAHHLLQTQAARIDDEDLRRSFLENVPAHREIVRLWQSSRAG